MMDAHRFLRMDTARERRAEAGRASLARFLLSSRLFQAGCQRSFWIWNKTFQGASILQVRQTHL